MITLRDFVISKGLLHEFNLQRKNCILEYNRNYYEQNKELHKKKYYRYQAKQTKEELKIRNDKIYEMYKNGFNQKYIADEFCLTRQGVNLIINKIK